MGQQGGGNEKKQRDWREVGTWPTSKHGESISLFLRFVKNYFRFLFAYHISAPSLNQYLRFLVSLTGGKTI
jgi:hypothetical protein